jgi:LCP family protein required for cell wall assembly
LYTAPSRSILPPELDPRIGRRRRRNRGLRRGLALLTVAVSVLVLVGSTGGYVVVRWFNGSIARIHLSFGDDRPPEADKGEQNWLLAGTDSRAGTGDEFGGDKVTGERSDTTILAHLDADGTTTLVSIPRDTLVTIPAYDDDKGVSHPARQDKFNAAILTGGPSLMVRTVEAMTGIRIDHYVSVDLAGFRRITDAIGGVNVCIKRSREVENGLDDNGRPFRSTNLSDPFSGFNGHVGVNHLDGEQALAFVRQRHGLEGGDTARIQRQQQFLGEVFRHATSTGVLLNPARVSSLIGAVRDSLTLDQDTSLSDLEKLAGRMRGLDPGRLRFETVPVRELKDTDPGAVTINGVLQYREPGRDRAVGSVLLVEQQKFNDLLNKLRAAGAVPTQTPTSESPTPVTVPPSQVVVTVQNGTTTPGIARKATDELGRQGFRTFAPVVADADTYGASEVRYAPGQEDSAQTVAAAVPGSVLKVDPTAVNGIVLVVGSSYVGTRQVQVEGADESASPSPSASASARPSPSSTVAPPPVTAADPGNRCTF